MNFLANSIQRMGHPHSKVTPTRMLVVLRLRNAAPHAARLSHTLGGIDYHDLCLASAVLGVPHATEDI